MLLNDPFPSDLITPMPGCGSTIGRGEYHSFWMQEIRSVYQGRSEEAVTKPRIAARARTEIASGVSTADDW
jgi:hypothetical protein